MTSLPDITEDPAPISITLGVADRYLLSCLLPRQGTRQVMVAADQLDRLIAFDEAEMEQFGIQYESNGAMSATSDVPVEFPLLTDQIQLIRQAINLADEQGRITRAMLPLLAKIDAVTEKLLPL